MGGHVDELAGGCDGGEGGLFDGRRFADKRHDGSVRRFTAVDIEQRHATDGLDAGGNGIDHGAVATLREVGYAFDEFHIAESTAARCRVIVQKSAQVELGISD